MEDYRKILKYAYKSQTNLEWLDFLSKKHLSSKSLSYNVFENAIAIPDTIVKGCYSGGVFNEAYNPVQSSFPRSSYKNANNLLKMVNPNDIPYIDDEVVYLGNIRNHYGSFLIDSISRLWFFQNNKKYNKFIFLLTMEECGDKMHRNIWRFLELLGIDKENITILKKPTKFKKIIVPDSSYSPAGSDSVYYTKEFLNTITTVANNADVFDTNCDKVYFSRINFSKKSKSEYGEKNIVSLLKNNGYHIICPESLSLDEQISYVLNCKVFSSIGGSLAHNIIFSLIKENKPKMFIFNRMDGYQWHQWILNEMADIELTYIDCYCEPYRRFFKPCVYGPFLYRINRNVKEFIKDYKFKKPRKMLFYNSYCFIMYTFQVFKTLVFNRKAKKQI